LNAKREVAVTLDPHSHASGGSVDLTLDTYTLKDRTVVRVGGEIDVYTAPKLREQLVDLVNAGKFHLVVEVESVEFLDSTGLGVLGWTQAGARTRWLAPPGLHPGADPEDLPYYRADEGLPDPQHGRGGRGRH
jgi:ABC-type transporter Mla MlaB component